MVDLAAVEKVVQPVGSYVTAAMSCLAAYYARKVWLKIETIPDHDPLNGDTGRTWVDGVNADRLRLRDLMRQHEDQAAVADAVSARSIGETV